MSRSNPRSSPQDEKPAQPTTSGSLKRKSTVAPGYLRDLLQARQRMKSMGLSGHTAGSSSSVGSSGSSSIGRASGSIVRQEQLYVAPTTLPLLFAQRKRYLQSNKRKGTPQPYRLNEELPTGLLSLPEDVLLKIVCYLRHDEIRPLFQVCKGLNHTLKTAVHFHFNYATPFRDTEERGPPQPRRDPAKRRAVTNLAAVLSHLTRSGRLTAEARAASGHITAPRALTFADTKGGGRQGGASVSVAALA